MRYSQMQSGPLTPLCEQLPISRISPRPSLQRGQDAGSLQGLAESIRRYGLLRPLIVRRTMPGRYVVLSGNRRLMACRMLGMTCVGVRILRNDARWQPAECLLDALMMRRLHYLEEADAVQALHEVHGMTWQELSAVLGGSEDMLRKQGILTMLPDALKALLLEEDVPLGLALTLLRLPDDGARVAMAERIAQEGLCIRDAALLISATLRQHGNKVGKREIQDSGRDEVCNRETLVEHDDKVGNWDNSCLHPQGRRMIGAVRDARLYLNTIRDIAMQMQEAGFRATVAERRVGGETELVIRVPVRRRRSDRYQSM